VQYLDNFNLNQIQTYFQGEDTINNINNTFTTAGSKKF